SGFSLILTMTISTIVIIAYTTFSDASIISTWSPIYGLGVIISCICFLVNRLARTFIRLLIWLWDENPQSTKYRVYVIAISNYVVRKFIYTKDTMTFELGKDFEDVSNVGDDEKEKIEDAVHYTSRILYWITFTLIIGTPLYVVSILFGYWVLVSYIS